MQEIHALQIRKPLRPDLFARLLESVESERRERVGRFRRREDALGCLFGDLLVRTVLIRATGVRNRDLIFSRDARGKPVCHVPRGVHFNVSHSGRWVLAAFDEEPIGADIERMKPVAPGVAELALSPSEVGMMESLAGSEKLSFFYETWTLKESWLKSSGRGLTKSLAEYTVIADAASGLYRIRNGKILDNAFLFLLPELDPDFRAAVCSGREEAPPPVAVETEEELAEFFLSDRS